MQLLSAGGVVALATAPFLLPYAQIRNEVWGTRTIAEVSRYSADVYSYATAFSEQRVWGRLLHGFPKAEGELFPGAIPLLLAVAGMFLGLVRAQPRESGARTPGWVIVTLTALAILHGVAAVVALAMRRVTIDLWGVSLRLGNVTQLLLRVAILLALVVALSPKARTRTVTFMRSR